MLVIVRYGSCRNGGSNHRGTRQYPPWHAAVRLNVVGCGVSMWRLQEAGWLTSSTVVHHDGCFFNLHDQIHNFALRLTQS
jgi:hypothetical protein